MNLSMWNIHDWLQDKGYKMLTFITYNNAVLKSARILNADVSDINIVYVGNNINDSRKLDSVFLVNGRDIIYIDDADHETVFNEVTQMFEFYSSWELEMNKSALYNNGLQKIIELSHPVFDIPIFIYDKYGKVLAISEEYPVDLHYHWEELYTLRYIPDNRMEELKQYGGLSDVFDKKGPTYFDDSPFGVPYLYSPIIINNEAMAHLVFFAALKPIPEDAIYLMGIMVETIKSHFQIHYADYVYNYQIASLMFSMLEKKDISDNILIAELYRINWKINDSYVILTFFEPVDGKPVMRDRIGNKLQENIKHCQKILFGEYLVLLVNLSKYGSEIQHLLRQINQIIGLHLRSGCSYPFDDFKKMSFYYTQALLTMNASQRIGEVAHINDYALPVINNLLSENVLLNSLIHPDLLSLRSYDLEHHTDFCDTLKVYLASSGNLSVLAKEIHIHRNTAIYRIHRIKELVHCDIEDPEIREYLFLSFHFMNK
ncbi:PucR family transcriptional regulator [Parasporobacterium paucivorans]|uniref:PucR C-terminal helix-turn-helix domain-containing protein n=1 Tax=Parasporobacterium paucivorans DSM 15970 TaxID=1122934 RepID=A0A1M6K4G0_9FIRM|nr:helix-turn-helix domain-containing protein [Parasporobacterium paucivorans]SHJ53829.1 PucR C-terminal helix-turn-helix domain-containing protein [Parasporobacterium paucivorans DSM 15970]